MSPAPQHPRSDDSIVLTMRSDTPIPHNSIAIIASVTIGLAFFLLIGFAVVTCIIPWLRTSRQAKAARKKALSDQKAWHASTRPVVQQPNTPRLLDAYTRAPHVQRQEETFGVDLEKNAVEHVPEQRVKGLSNGQEKMRASCDLGMQHISDRDSSTTATTHVSIGVGVPVKLPASNLPSEVYYSRRA